MKRLLSLLVCFCVLSGCSSDTKELDVAMELRRRLCSGGCSFVATVYADYGQDVHEFCMDCQVDNRGDLSFTVLAPQTISGITGRIREDSGALTFDDKVLAFELLADGLLSPISAPWLLVRGLRSGYMAAAGPDGDSIRLQIDDSFQGETLQLDVWLTDDGIPSTAYYSWKGTNILSIRVESFCLL